MEFSALSSGKILEFLPCIPWFHKYTIQQKYSLYLPITPIASAFPYPESGKWRAGAGAGDLFYTSPISLGTLFVYIYFYIQEVYWHHKGHLRSQRSLTCNGISYWSFVYKNFFHWILISLLCCLCQFWEISCLHKKADMFVSLIWKFIFFHIHILDLNSEDTDCEYSFYMIFLKWCNWWILH